jgi:hypothetical protein
MPVQSDPLLTPEEAAQYLHCSKQLLAVDRHRALQGGTPPRVPYVRVTERVVRYRQSDLDAHLAAHRVG